jgi:hypothetical protein
VRIPGLRAGRAVAAPLGWALRVAGFAARGALAVPELGGEVGESFDELLDQGQDPRDQRRREPPCFGDSRRHVLAELLEQSGEAVC